MKFGVREICEVVLKAKSTQKIGNKIFYKNEPVIYFDTLKTSSVEGAATTVYAQGGRGNSRLIAWEGERTVTFTMEDALISAEGFMILSGAGLVEPAGAPGQSIKQHITETLDASMAKDEEAKSKVAIEDGNLLIELSHKPFLPAGNEDFAYVMLVKDGEIISEPYIPQHGKNAITEIDQDNDGATGYVIKVVGDELREGYEGINGDEWAFASLDFDSVIVDYYTERTAEGTKQIEITADKFGGNYYLEASTLFRNQNGVDLPAEFVIPNCKIQSNFTFSMASSGDPSTFTFTMDAFPDYTRFDHSKKVLAAIQIIEDNEFDSLARTMTAHDKKHESHFA